MIIIFLAGLAGGLARGLVGIAKNIISSPEKQRKFAPEYFAVTLTEAGCLGLLVGFFLSEDPRFAFLAGYAGTDFLEGLYKLKMKKL